MGDPRSWESWLCVSGQSKNDWLHLKGVTDLCISTYVMGVSLVLMNRIHLFKGWTVHHPQLGVDFSADTGLDWSLGLGCSGGIFCECLRSPREDGRLTRGLPTLRLC